MLWKGYKNELDIDYLRNVEVTNSNSNESHKRFNLEWERYKKDDRPIYRAIFAAYRKDLIQPCFASELL